jgi:elongation factor P
MLDINQIKTGKKIILDGEPFAVLFDQHSKTGRAGAVLRTKLKNLKSGAIVSKTFQGADKVQEAEIEKQKAQFLYGDNSGYYFMNNATFEQFSLPNEVIGEAKRFLKEGTDLDVIYFSSVPINIELPIKMDFEVVEAPPAVKGNTVDGGSKQVIIETGVKINAPLFIKTGDIIKINTETGEYAERTKK